MKNKIITARTTRRELISFLICFVMAFILNLIGIILSGSPAKELITKLHTVLLIALGFYLAVAILRVLYALVGRFWLRIKK